MADFEWLEGPWLDGLATGDLDLEATMVRLLLAQMTWNSKRVARSDGVRSPARGAGDQSPGC